ncbi:ATPase [Aureococcus anophagefferens]|nr:ATPase [Aureococcus anophagefferens]
MSMNAIPEPVQPASLELVLADYIKAEGVEVAETYKPILAYVSNLASNQCIAETFHMFEWEKTCQAYLEPIMDAEKAAVVTKKFMDESGSKQAWLCDFLTGPACAHVTTLVVSHDSKFLNKVLTDVIHYENMRLKRYTGNLDQFVEKCPMAKAYFSIHDTEMKFTFPVPGPLEGVKSKTKAIIQAKNISFTSAFHHIEQHLEMSPVEYIQWRFSGGLDKEQQAMEAAQMTDEEKAKLKQNFVVYLKELAAELDEAGNATGERQIIFEKMEPLKAGQKPPPTDIQNGIFPDCVRQIKQLVGRRSRHGDYEYEVKWAKQDGTSMEDNKNLYLPKVVLESNGFFKLMKAIDDKIAAEAGNVKPLTTGCIQKHLDDFGLMEFGTYGKMKNLSGGQKVKTEGGVLMISHNAEFFGDIAPEIWEVPGDQKVHISGAEWMEAVRAGARGGRRPRRRRADPGGGQVRRLGNKIESVTAAADVDRDMIKRMTKQLKSLKDRLKKGDGSVEDQIFELEDKLDAANAMMKKEKEAAKAEKEAQKKLNKKEKAPADKKKASKKK